MSARVCFVVGARPNFMKSAPVYRELAALDPSLELVLLHTGQHYDDAMSDVFFRELGMPRPDEFLGVGSGSHAEQTAKALVGVEQVLLEREIDLCVVAGDVNSTLAGALAAVKLGIPVAHIEAGLRSFDRAMPEEHNRVLTDHVSDILLAHSEEAITNLQREGITSGVHLVGNTMIDSLLAHLDRPGRGSSWEQFGLAPGEYALVTLHRPALVDDPAKLTAVTDGLIALAARPARRSSRCTRGRCATSRRPATTRACATPACSRPSRSATSTSSASRPTPPSSSPTPAASRRRRRRSASAASRCATRPSAGHGGARHEHRARREAGADRRDPAAARAAEAGRGRSPAGTAHAGARAAAVLFDQLQ